MEREMVRPITRVALGASVLAGGLAFLGTIAVGVVALIFARTIVTPPASRPEDVRILADDAHTITLSATLDSLTPGRYSLWFTADSGHAKVGEILSFTTDTVTRELLGVDCGDLAGAHRGRFSGWFYLSPAELGFAWSDVSIETDLGPAPAWLIEPEETTDLWMIGVHGRAVRRQEALRAVPVFRKCGFNSLLISYRNDGDAPRSSDHRYALGDTEWRDVESAIAYALAHGAKRVVLMGWSMGGASVLQAITRSRHAACVDGVVLDSPVVDWVTALHFQGVLNRLPRVVQWGALTLLGSRWARLFTGQAAPIDLRRLDIVARASELTVPILLLHSVDDGFIPATASRALADARPDIVTFEEFVTARHTKLWNYDSSRWNSAISRWLGQLEPQRRLHRANR